MTLTPALVFLALASSALTVWALRPRTLKGFPLLLLLFLGGVLGFLWGLGSLVWEILVRHVL
mgnify:CR=1 FL=1